LKAKQNEPKFMDANRTTIAAVIAVVAIALLAGLFILPSIQGKGQPQLKLIEISYPNCSDCFDVSDTINKITSLNATIQSRDRVYFGSDESKALITKYGIKRIPTILIRGDVAKTLELKELWGLLGEVKEDGTVVITKITPPYVEASSGEIRGRVTATHVLAYNCSVCVDYYAVVDQLRNVGVRIVEEKSINYSANSTLASSYNITRIPTLILSKDIMEYPAVATYLKKLGSFEKDGSFVLRETGVPYRDLELNKTVGIVALVNIFDSDCKECYNVSIHRRLLERDYGLVIGSETSFDAKSTSGSYLIRAYNITKIPTIMLSPAAQLYRSILQVWPEVGTFEEDGWLVFRNIEALGKNVTYEEIMGQDTNQSSVNTSIS
jgi:hypothetical protein